MHSLSNTKMIQKEGGKTSFFPDPRLPWLYIQRKKAQCAERRKNSNANSRNLDERLADEGGR